MRRRALREGQRRGLVWKCGGPPHLTVGRLRFLSFPLTGFLVLPPNGVLRVLVDDHVATADGALDGSGAVPSRCRRGAPARSQPTSLRAYAVVRFGSQPSSMRTYVRVNEATILHADADAF